MASHLRDAARRHVLLVASEESAGLLQPAPHDHPPFFRTSDPGDALRLLSSGPFDAVVVRLPVDNWEPAEILEEIQRRSSGIPVVFIGDDAVAEAVRLVRLGAWHYLTANAGVDDILAALPVAGSGVAESPAWRKLMVGESTAIRKVADTITLIGRRRSTVLITGETGTGKEVAARAIQLAGNRAQREFVAVNCSALPENLLEAELFGHVKGAFTGAIQHRVGRFEQANHGTIFLDEIAELPLDLQAKLLRVLQEREFQRLGSGEPVRVDVRVIAACNIDLHDRIRAGKFREDLYYRLNVVPLTMPPLRERVSDIPLLVHHFLEKICRHEDVSLRRIAPETLDRLGRYGWPGNVRQVENAVEMAVALSGDRDVLYPGDFPLPPAATARVTATPAPSLIPVPREGLDFEHTVDAIERGLLEQALRMSNGNKKMAADLLRLKRTTLTAKLKALEVSAAR